MELRWSGAKIPHATSQGWDHRDAALQQRWRGPSSRSNWLVPGRVLCGDQPYTLDKAEGRAGLAACDVSTIDRLPPYKSGDGRRQEQLRQLDDQADRQEAGEICELLDRRSERGG